MAVDRERRGGTTLFAVIVGLVVGAVAVRSSQIAGLLAVSVIAVVSLVALCRTLARWPEDPSASLSALRWTMASFAIHLFLGMVIFNVGGLRNFLGPDAGNYHNFALQIVSHWAGHAPMPRITPGKEGYYYMLASLYWIFGTTSWGGIALNAFLAAALIPIVSDTAHRLFGIATVRYIPMLFLLVPGMLLWPSQLLKEAPFLLLLAVAANCAARLIDRYSLTPLLWFAAVLPAFLLFRPQIGFAVLAGVLAGLVLGRRQLVGGLVGGLVATAMVGAVVASGIGSSGYQTAVSTNLDQANQVRRGSSARVSSGFGTDADISTTNRALSFLPIGLASITLGPAPWQLQGGRQLVALPDMAAWWIMCVGIWWGVRAAKRRGRQWLVLAVPAAATTAVIALSVGNYGTVVRERMQILVLLAPVIALGFADRRAHREQQAEVAAAS